jgi:hypothetical protein
LNRMHLLYIAVKKKFFMHSYCMRGKNRVVQPGKSSSTV